MLTRRTFLGSAAAVAAVANLKGPLSVVANASEISAAAVSKDDVLQWADPKIGTGGHGHTYPGATVPFGAMQLSPDTYNEGWDWCSGYHLSDTSIMGFSHTHLSGTGAADLLDFLVTPGVGEAKLVPGTRENPESGYRSRFSHDSEVATPGYYSVMLDTPKVKAELTATERVGVHRYTFPASDNAYILVDLNHAQLRKGKSTVVSGELDRTGSDSIAGGHVTNAWGPGRHAYFALQVSKQPKQMMFYRDDAVVPTGKTEGANLKCVMTFETAADEKILVKVGISGVSEAGAAGNIAAEVPGWDFDGVRMAAEAKWRQQLGKVHASFANDGHKKVFYSALYHMSLGPTLYDDADGKYRGMDNAVHTLSAGQRNYTTFSLWDTFRAAHPAYTILEPERTPQFVNTLIRMGAESPAGAAVWPLHGRETECMTGFHCASVIAEARNKGVAGPDYAKAYEVLKRGRLDDVKGMQWHKDKGFIAADLEGESVSKHFEYCYDDWAMANLAKSLKMDDACAEHIQISKGYKNNWDESTGFMRPKMADGSWATPFDPIAMGHSKRWVDYTESNAWQSTFALQHDSAGLIEVMGGRPKFIAKMDELFNQPSTLPPDAPPDIAGMVGQYAHGNEPSHHIAYLYVYAGAPHKTQSRVRSLMETMYSPNPDGMQGNEDVGQMSAWFLLSAMGFYPVDPVSGVYVLGSPLLENATVNLGGGKVLHIDVTRKNATDAYVKEFYVNGKKQDKAWFRHSDIAKGGSLKFVMSDTANEILGADVKVAPPSLVV
jgi:predicted alpha-1,2-mannosidase